MPAIQWDCRGDSELQRLDLLPPQPLHAAAGLRPPRRPGGHQRGQQVPPGPHLPGEGLHLRLPLQRLQRHLQTECEERAGLQQ